VDHEDNYENYEPEPGDLVTPYERFIEELDDRLAGLISKCEYDEDFEADYDEDGLAGVYTTLTLVATPEVRATLMESRDALTESARLAGITSLILAVASWDRHDLLTDEGTQVAALGTKPERERPDLEEVRAEVEREMELLIEIATHEKPIAEAREEYKARRSRVRAALRALGLPDPNTWADPSAWWDDVSGLSTYRERRQFVRNAYSDLLKALEHYHEFSLDPRLEPKEIGWGRIDAQLRQLPEKLRTARTPEDFKAVGHLCREIILTLGRVLYDETKHLPHGENAPQLDNAKARIDAVIAVELSGGDNERLRKLARATWDFVQEVVHSAETESEATIAAISTRQLVTTLKLALPQEVVVDNDEDDHEAEKRRAVAEQEAENYDYWAEQADD
jgi:hypothetical protein